MGGERGCREVAVNGAAGSKVQAVGIGTRGIPKRGRLGRPFANHVLFREPGMEASVILDHAFVILRKLLVSLFGSTTTLSGPIEPSNPYVLFTLSNHTS